MTGSFKAGRAETPIPPVRSGRRRQLVGAAIVAVVVVVAALISWCSLGDPQASERASSWQPPKDSLLASPMITMPVSGWRSTTADFGLPAGTSFVTDPAPARSRPFIGSVGTRGYFLAGRPATPREWWLVGIDIADRSALFTPVPLFAEDIYPPQCFLNGPDEILCLRTDAGRETAWVIDSRSGELTFAGPTDLSRAPGRFAVRQVGIYAVAEEQHRGVSGVGSRAQRTWFVPGNGSVDNLGRSDLAAIPVATQLVGGPGSETRVVFNLPDGEILSPPAGPGRRRLNATVYPGGFAVEEGVDEGRVTNPDEIRFFDYEGKQLGRAETTATLVTYSPDLPMSQRGSETATVYGRDGAVVAQLPRGNPSASVRLVGSDLFVDESSSPSFPEWTQFDLAAGGTPGRTCDLRISDRLGSDGRILVLGIANPGSEYAAKGVDPRSCETLWRLGKRPQSYSTVVRIGTALVQLSDDGTQLASLVAPGPS